MKIEEYEKIKAAGLAMNPKGGIYCPHCNRGLRFNSGQPAVYHSVECPVSKTKVEAGSCYIQYFWI